MNGASGGITLQCSRPVFAGQAAYCCGIDLNLCQRIAFGAANCRAFPIITGVNIYEGWDNPITWTLVGNNIWSREQSDNPQRMWINGEEVLRNVTIDNCELDSKFNFSYGANKGIDDGIQITTGANNCIVKNSIIKDFGHAGIYLKALNTSDNGVYDNKIFGNYITGENVTYQRGINTDGYENKCRDNEFFYNIIRNTTVRNQINGNNNWIHHNIIYGMKNSPAKSYATAQGFDLQCYGINQGQEILETI